MRSSSGCDVNWLCLIVSSTAAVGDWCISILAVVVNDKYGKLNVIECACIKLKVHLTPNNLNL